MKRLIALCAALCAAHCAPAGEALTLEDLCASKYHARLVGGAAPMNDGETYSRLSPDGKRIAAYSFRTGRETAVLCDVDNMKGRAGLTRLDGYIMSPDESHILLQTATRPIYRRSKTAEYYIYNVRNRTCARLSDGGPQEAPVWSRDGNMVAFVRGGDIFLVKLLFNNSESRVTKDGKEGEVINGKPDWVNEEEFATSRSLEFNEDNTMLAWVRYDESRVPSFSFPLYKGLAPEREDCAQYPGSYSYKYPVAGARNSRVSVHTFDIKSRVTRQMQLPVDSDGYVPRIFFTRDAEKLLVLTQTRHQDRLDVVLANPRSRECRVIVREKAERYIADDTYQNFLVTDGGFVMMSERSGFSHLYLYDLTGTMRRRLTSGDFPVTALYGYDPRSGAVYYACADESPLRRAVCRADAKGRVTRLAAEPGTNGALFSKGFRYFMNTYSNLSTPYVTTLRDASSGKTLATLEDNKELRARLSSCGLGERRAFSFRTGEGVELNGLMVLPPGFNEGKRYPAVLFQYGGPGSQQAVDSWGAGNMGGMLYEEYLAQRGFVSIVVDGRGTGGRGREFEQCTYLKLGQLESRDQVEAALYAGSLPFVDKERIGIWGWSYGGFNTLMSMSEGRPVFRAGVAVAAPTSWRYYDTVYTERYMRTPGENGGGYDVCPIGLAPKLSGHLLLCHGLADDNVHFRNCAEYAEALTQAGKDFRMLTYTNRNHGIYGGGTRLHLFRQITGHFEQYLK